MFFARYNIDPLAEVGDYDVKKIMQELEGQSMGMSNDRINYQNNTETITIRSQGKNGRRYNSGARERFYNVRKNCFH